MKFIIQYVSRRSWCNGADPEDQAWRTAAGESFAGTQEQADAYARLLDHDTDLEFYHRAVAALQEAS